MTLLEARTRAEHISTELRRAADVPWHLTADGGVRVRIYEHNGDYIIGEDKTGKALHVLDVVDTGNGYDYAIY